MIGKAQAVFKSIWPMTLRVIGAAATSLLGGLVGMLLKEWVDNYYNLNLTKSI